MDASEHKSGRWSDSLRRTCASILGLAQSRFELFAVELQEEKLRALNVIVWLVMALALGVARLLIVPPALAASSRWLPMWPRWRPAQASALLTR